MCQHAWNHGREKRKAKSGWWSRMFGLAYTFSHLTLGTHWRLMPPVWRLTETTAAQPPDLQPKTTHTHIAFVVNCWHTKTRVLHVISGGTEAGELFCCVFTHIYWTNNTVEYMLACVCECMWKVTELLLADWRQSLAERQELLQASALQPVQHKQENEWLF